MGLIVIAAIHVTVCGVLTQVVLSSIVRLVSAVITTATAVHLLFREVLIHLGQLLLNFVKLVFQLCEARVLSALAVMNPFYDSLNAVKTRKDVSVQSV